MLPATQLGVTHVRMLVDNFSVNGADAIVTASEIRFIGNVRELPRVRVFRSRQSMGASIYGRVKRV